MDALAGLREKLAAAEARLRRLRPPGGADACVSGERAADLLLALAQSMPPTSGATLRALAVRSSLKVHVVHRVAGGGATRMTRTDVHLTWVARKRRVGVRGRYTVWAAGARFVPPPPPEPVRAVNVARHDGPAPAANAITDWCRAELGDSCAPLGEDAAGLCFALCLAKLRWWEFAGAEFAAFLARYPACAAPVWSAPSLVFPAEAPCRSSSPKPP